MESRDKMDAIRSEIFDKIREYYAVKEKCEEFIPGKTNLQYAGAVYDHNEVNAMMGAILDGWFGLSKNAVEFERRLAEYLGVAEVVLTNSGSSANLLAVSALTARQLGDRRLKKGDEIITSASGFPNTLNPIIQNGLIPVFVDCKLGNYNIDLDMVETAITDKTRGIIFAHTLGNPVDMDRVMAIAKKHDLFVIEDTCDALGTRLGGRMAGSFGTASTYSFYVAHHITMGEGGAIATNDRNLARIIRSFRDWGRACVCSPCKMFIDPNYNCPARFNPSSKFLADKLSDEAVEAYDRRYTYIELGYNLKPLEFQAAMGVEQLKRLPDLVAARKENFKKFYEYFKRYENYFMLPEWDIENADISWFGFPLTIKEGAPFKRIEIVEYLKDRMIETRLLFAGNYLRQPAYEDMECRIAGEIKNADTVMNNTFFFGLYKGITDEKLRYIFSTLDEYFESKK